MADSNIFDQAAASSAPASGGNIFDQAASAPAASSASVAPPPDLNVDKARIGASPVISTDALKPASTPFDKAPGYNPADAAFEQNAGASYTMRPNAPAPKTVADIAPAARAGSTMVPTANAPLSQGASRPAANMKPSALSNPEPPGLADSLKEAALVGTGAKPLEMLGKAAVSTGKDLIQGTQATVGQTGEPFDRAKFVKGITQLVSGGSKVAITLSAPELMELGAAADSGNIAAQGSIIKILSAAEAGNVASDVGGKVSDKLNLSPETKDLIQTAAFFLPTLAGAMKFKGGAGVDAQGNPGIGVSSKGGGFRAGAVGTPEAFDIRAQVGGTRVGVKIPRGGGEPAPVVDPAQILASQQAEAGTNAIIRAAVKQQQAATVVAGGPPPPPPGPKLPDAMQKGVVSPQAVQDIATMIHLAPVDQHPQLLMEAHGKLTEYIQKQGRIIGPDGKLQIAETPQQAAKLAQNIINDEVDRQSTAKEDAAKQQADVEKQQAAATKEATTPAEDGGLSPADQQWARAKTIIESTTTKPGQSITSVLQRNLGVGGATAQQMMQKYQKEQTEAALPTVGGKGHEVVEESRATVDAQLEAMKRGDTNVVMLPEGSRYMPKVPDGMKMMSVTGNAPGAGKYLYNPQAIRASTIKEAAKAGTHGDLLGHIQPKSEIAAAPEKPTVVVQAQDKVTGTPIQDSEVHPERVEQQKEAMAERHPDAKIVVKPTHEVLIDRLEAQKEEEATPVATAEPTTDIFDEAAKPEETKSAETAPAKEVVKKANSERKGGRGKSPEQEAAGEQRGVAPAAPKPSKQVAKKEVAPVNKGDTVTFKDRTGKMQTGTIAHAGDRMVRVKVDGKEYTTFRGGVKPVEITDNIPPVTRDSGAGDKSTQPKEETPAGAIPELRSLEDIHRILQDNSDKELYVRSSSGPSYDAKQKYSMDYQQMREHTGLSSIRIEPEWLKNEYEHFDEHTLLPYILSRLTEYGHRPPIKGVKQRLWIYEGEKVGEDSDGYDSIRVIRPVAVIAKSLAENAKRIELEGKISSILRGTHSIAHGRERIKVARAKGDSAQTIFGLEVALRLRESSLAELSDKYKGQYGKVDFDSLLKRLSSSETSPAPSIGAVLNGGRSPVEKPVVSEAMENFDAAIENTGADVVEGKVSKSDPEQVAQWKAKISLLQSRISTTHHADLGELRDEIGVLEDNLRRVEFADRVDKAHKLTPPDDAELKAKYSGAEYQREYFKSALQQVKDAGIERIDKKGTGKETWEWLAEDKSRPVGEFEEYPEKQLYIHVPGDGHFLINNTPYAIERALKGAAKGFAKPKAQTTRKLPANPRSPAEFDNNKYIAGLKKEIDELTTNANRPHNWQDQLKAARENLAEAQKGKQPTEPVPKPESIEEAKAAADAHLSDMETAVTAYIDSHTSGGTLTISSDAAREMLPGYSTVADRMQNTVALGPASSKLADAVWQKAMADGPSDDKYGVEFLTGSPGSGKTSSVIGHDLTDSKFKVVSEGMMDNFDKSWERIQQAIDAGFTPTLRIVYADDPKTTLRRAVNRAMEHGRFVPIKLMSRLYVEIPKTVQQLAERFGDKLGIDAVDNSQDNAPAKHSTINDAVDATGAYTQETAQEAMLHELDQLHNDGKLTADLARRFRGDLKASDSAGASKDGERELAEAVESANRAGPQGPKGSRAVKLPPAPPANAPRKEIEKYLQKKGVIEAIFKPGSIVPVYAGWDRVISYDPITRTVRAQESDADGTLVSGERPREYHGNIDVAKYRALVANNNRIASKPDDGVTLRSSLFGVDILAKFMADQGQKLWEKDIAPHLGTTLDTVKRAATQTAGLLYPRMGANADALDSLFRAKGEREEARFLLDRMEGGLEKFFDKMPEAARLAFIDRYKMGVGQLDPTLQKIESLMRTIDNATFQRAQAYKPSMTAKEDHYRVLWKVIPDPSGTRGNPTANTSRVGQGRRPFEGDKGFMKRATLDTISEGIHYGGVPVSTNPWKMFTLAQQSMMQYITAQDHWKDLKSLGLRKFVKPGQKRPDGWVKLDDRLAKSFFPASSGEGMVQAGEWYLEPTAGRILNNYLSRDLIRENAIGNVLMAAKNLSTAIELGLSPFHFGFETVEAMGSQLGLGVQRLWNNGIRLGDSAEAMRGVKEIATSMAAPVLMARAGGNMLKMVDSPQTFAQTKRGMSFLGKYPDAPQLLKELFTGGYQWGMNPDYKFDPVKSMQQTLTDKNYGGAMLRLVPWANHVIMAPLFEHYIPRLKLGFALAQYSQQLAENNRQLANGDTTRATIARQVIDTAENRFGEMNFSNILWNNTFKSVAQFLFRSITWKLGNWRGLGSAAGPEAYRAFADPIQAMIEDAKAGKKQRPAGEYIPKIGMNQAWLIGMATATAVLGTLLTKLWTHRYPWEFAEGDDGHLLLEMTHPRTGQVDARTGKPERISLPTGFKDFEHAYLHPREYLRGSMSGTAGSFVDLLENRDFFNNYVYDPNAPLYQQVSEAVKYATPKPIAAQGLTDEHGGQTTMSKALKASGLSPTTRERDLSPAETRMQEILRARRTPLTPQQVKDREDQDAMVKTPTVRQMHAELKRGHTEYVQREFNNMSYADAREVFYKLATPAEQRILKPMMDKKRMALLKRNPDAVRRADAETHP